MTEELGKSVLLGKPVIHIQQGNDEVVVIDSSSNRYKVIVNYLSVNTLYMPTIYHVD